MTPLSTHLPGCRRSDEADKESWLFLCACINIFVGTLVVLGKILDENDLMVRAQKLCCETPKANILRTVARYTI